MLVDEIESWIPEQVFFSSDKYVFKKFEPATNVIGFYSSGAWLREKKGYTDLGHNDAQNQRMVLEALSEYVSNRYMSTSSTVSLISFDLLPSVCRYRQTAVLHVLPTPI